MNRDRADLRGEELADLRATLRAQGFGDEEQWLEYAVRHGIRPVSAVRLPACPDCGSRERTTIGQYVYYSNLIQFVECRGCRLIYSDTRVSPAVLQNHFERAYKDHAYFLRSRGGIFRQLAEVAARRLPNQGAVLDVGGATGHLMEVLRARRPDARITVNDLSTAACAAAQHRGFETVPGAIADLVSLDRAFDVVIMSDVIYYEPNPAGLWAAIRKLVARHGTLILRVPNRVLLIKWACAWQAIVAAVTKRPRDRVPFFNPEHLFAFSRRFLARRLRQLGFTEIRCLPSRMLRGSAGASPAIAAWEAAARAAHLVSFEQIVLTPSMLVVARRRA